MKNSVVILMTTLFFSCTNDIKSVRDFLADKNLPIGVAENINLIYKDSAKITTVLRSPILNDYSNRKAHPYSEFPKGLYITKLGSQNDSTSITGNYAITYTKTEISEIRGDVVVKNYKKKYSLYTSQLFWDQKQHYFITNKKFTLITPTDTLHGVGFESKEDLSLWHATDNSGSISVADDS